ncbi:MAG TPA: acyl carrier protein [Chitinophaga sp.]|uniref:acyl carrier protein n=1 Tax=Chitinophaga sp. TaxID=1869181 RepID=UPI002BA44763|nr:acyl carrier protein [Chitinophaga sp.]HVI45322.1 acyl carrier protein [Chitinophaga sp.]
MRNEVIAVIKENLLEIIPELSGSQISLDDTFVDLGANSLDRGELITLTLERLNLEISRIEFVGAQTINELADLIIEKK